MNKNGFIVSFADFIKGLLIGFIVGVVLVFLMAKGIVPSFGLF